MNPAPKNNLVVFDTNMIEGRYLAALLNGERCRDFDLVRSSGFIPTAHVRSYYEICHHAKLGTKKLPWMQESLGYPGGIERGKEILRRLPNCDADSQAYYWFSLCEEWRGLDWEDEAASLCAIVKPSAREAILHETRTRRDFCTWKFSLSAFCMQIWDTLSQHMQILTADTLGIPTHEISQKRLRLYDEIALYSIIPTEDLDIVIGTLIANARAFISQDNKLVQLGGLSLDANHHTAFVHADQLHEAIKNSFPFRWSRHRPTHDDSLDRARATERAGRASRVSK